MKTNLPSPKSKRAVQRLLVNPDFNQDIATLRTKWGVDFENPNRENNLKKIDDFKFKYYDRPYSVEDEDLEINLKPRTPCIRDLLTVLKKYNLDSNYWLAFVWKYFKDGYNEPIEMFGETQPIVRLDAPRDETKLKIVIELGENTTFRDVKAAWHNVEKLREFLGKKPRVKEWKNLDRDFKVYQLYEQGKAINEICSILRKENGIDLDYGNIKKIVTEFRKRMGLKKDKTKKLKTFGKLR